MISDSILIWRSACATDVGKVRRVNEDAYLDLHELGLWVVADGMGGHMAGDVASRMIVESCKQIDEPKDLNSFIADVEYRLIEVNRKLREMAEQQYNDSTIGSTVAALLAYDRQCACLWAGDSRIYRLRDNKLEQMTRDHSMVEEYLAEGFMSPEEVYKSGLANALTRAIGAQDELEVDVRIEDMQDGDSSRLLEIEADSLEVSRMFRTSAHARSITIDRKREALYVLSFMHGTLTAVDIKTGSKIWTIKTGGKPGGLCIDGDSLFVSSRRGILRIDLDTVWDSANIPTRN